MQVRRPRPGEREAEIEAREAIPDPKKPRNWDIWVTMGVMVLSLLTGIVFRIAEMEFNKNICGAIFIMSLVYYTYYLLYARHKRGRDYREKVRDRDNLRNMAIRNRISGRPWRAPTRVPGGEALRHNEPQRQPHWRSVDQIWDTKN